MFFLCENKTKAIMKRANISKKVSFPKKNKNAKGSANAAMIELADTYFVIITDTRKTTRQTRKTGNDIPIIAPVNVAMPFPPLNPA